jgi:2-dehydro-3-deoxyphosphogluconate aldolase/(4S)-4-hydroxy-2-oxoglutarate aldolase
MPYDRKVAGMKKTLGIILEKRIIAVIRGISSAHVASTAEALVDGGIVCLEVTFDAGSREKSEDALRSIAMLKQAYGDGIALGAGTVLTAQQARDAAQAGAAYIISPDANREVIEETVKLGLVSMPGAMTPTEILGAWRWGADAIKLFPVSSLGLEYIRSVKAPINHIPLFAVGGVNPDNARCFLEAGCAGVSAGGNLVDKRLIEAGDYGAIRSLAQAYVRACSGEA